MAYEFENRHGNVIWRGVILNKSNVSIDDGSIQIVSNGISLFAQKKITADFNLFTEETEDRIKSTYCDINILASESNTFEDLYTEEERQNYLILYKNNIIEYVGFINPDGIFESQVSHKWYITLRASDGLDALSNLAYVDDEGQKYLGYAEPDKIISRALRRLRLGVLLINKWNDTPNAPFYLNYFDDNGVDYYSFFTLKFNQDLFFDLENIDDCASVINEILELCNCVLFQNQGKWQILHEYDYASPLIGDLFLNSFGFSVENETYINDTSFRFNVDVKSHIKGGSIFWCNENQRTQTKPSLGAIRYSFDFGSPSPITDNPNLLHESSVLDGYTVLKTYDNRFFLSDNGVTTSYKYGGDNTHEYYFESDPVSINEGEVFNVVVDWYIGKNTDIFSEQERNDVIPNYIAYELEHTDTSGNKLYFSNLIGYKDWFSEWQGVYTVGDPNPFVILDAKGVFIDVKSTLENITAPDDGTLIVRFMKIAQDADKPTLFQRWSYAEIKRFEIIPISEEDNSIGIEHTSQQLNRLSSVIKESKELKFSNSEEGQLKYKGTILNKDDEVLLNKFIVSTDATERSLLELITREVLREKQTPRKQYSGDVYGYINRIARVNIDGFEHPFKVVSNSYNSQTNVTSLVLEEVKPQTISSAGIRYSKQKIYSESIKPTIT